MLPITINEFLQKKTNYKIKLNSGLDDIDLDKKEILSNGERIPFDDLVLTVPAHELKDVFSKRSKTEDSARQSILIEVNLLL
jgi:protoporphyrinogen oxidase